MNCTYFLQGGTGCDGYMTNDDVLEQLEAAIAIVKEFYPDEDHVFVYNNAPTHLKREDGELTAARMPKGPSETFGVDVDMVNPATGKPVHDENKKKRKEKVRMANSKLHDGSIQMFYYPNDYEVVELRGHFKGTEVLLTERGYNVRGKKSQCGKSFQRDCPKDRTDCCCRRMMYNEPDFRDVLSRLEKLAKKQGVQVLFLPKFHCELNFIEMCWGYAKRRYRVLPEGKSQAELEKNVLKVLDDIPLETMCRYCFLSLFLVKRSLTKSNRFSVRSLCFASAYLRGLNG